MKELRELDPEELGNEAIRVLGLIAAEFKSDPMSVQCFDLKIVQEAIALSEERLRRDREIDRTFGPRRKWSR